MSDFFGTLPQWISAAAALTGLGIAYGASRTWQNTLREKRGDDLLTATLDLAGQVGATRAAVDKDSSAIYGSNVDRLFASSRTLLKAFVVAERSYRLDEAMLVGVRGFIERTVENVGSLDHVPRATALASYQNLQNEAARFTTYVRSVVT